MEDLPGQESVPRRIVDILGAILVLVGLSPLYLLIALAIVMEGPGPVFFRQIRTGKNRAPFRILKFRTMVPDAHKKGPSVSGRQDPRITQIGHLLRKTKLDEFPQLWNVLKGEMTLIGPRAEVPEMIRHYTEDELQILRYRPGLTAPGQLFFTTDQSQELDKVDDAETYYIQHQMHPKLAMDLAYLRDRSASNDLKVVARTVRLLFTGR
jgi:lipopolysaccharide/colanic/teichoic acid biosynthesis glycosyltransferase